MPSQKFVDLEDAVEQWGWVQYDENARSKKQKQLRERMTKEHDPCIGVEIDWSRVEFRDHTTWSPLVDDEDDADSNRNLEQGDSPAVVRSSRPSDVQGSDVNILFNTEFTNDTGKEQVYTLRIDKTTRSTCTTEIEHGVTKGVDIGVALKMPGEVFEANAGFHREVTLTKTEGQTIEEELSWGAESTITVEQDKIAKAKLIVREKKQSGDFQVDTKAQGRVLISYTNRTDNNSLLFTQSGKIDFIMKEYLESKRKINHTFDFVEVKDGTVHIKTKGTCRFRYGIKQEIAVVQEPIKRGIYAIEN